MNDPAGSDTEQETSSGDSQLSTRQQVIRFGAIAAILSAVLAVAANLSEIAGWFAPDETRELVEETQVKVETTGAKVDELLVLLRNQAAASGVDLDIESEVAIRNAVLAIVASGDATKRAAVAQLEQGDVAAAAETMSDVAAEQASAVSQAGSAAAASWAEAGALFRTFDFDRAIHAYREAVRLDPENARFRDRLGHTYLLAGKLEMAESVFDDLMAVEGGPAVRASALNGLGIVAQRRGDYGTADRFAQEALGNAETAGDVIDLIHARLLLGQLARRRGDAGNARDHLQIALSLAEDADNELARANALSSLSILAAERNAFDEAESLMREVLEIHRDRNDLAKQADTLGNLGAIALSRGDTDAAETILLETVEMKEQLDWDSSAVYDLINLGTIAANREDYGLADRYLSRAEAIAIRHGLLELAPVIAYNRGALAASRGDTDTACTLWAEAAPALESMGSQHATVASGRLEAECRQPSGAPQ